MLLIEDGDSVRSSKGFGLSSRFHIRAGLLIGALVGLAGCSSQQGAQRYSSYGGGGVDPRYGVKASPRVIAEGEEVPKGGGGYMVGKPYKIAGKTYFPSEKPYAGSGTASWYGADFHGRRTANGEIFDRNSISAAHPTMPLPSYARVTNLRNARSMVVRVNDRGPYHGGRVMDVSQRVAEALDFRSAGTANVKVEWLGNARLGGDNDATLLATLRDDGQPATLDGLAPVMTAAAEEPVQTASLDREERRAERRAKRDSERAEKAAEQPVEKTKVKTIETLAADTAEAEQQEQEQEAETTGAVAKRPKAKAMTVLAKAAPTPPTRPETLAAAGEDTAAEVVEKPTPY
jgi:rare lipoprotein A